MKVHMEISSAIMDPELGRSAFTVERLSYTRSASGTASRSQTYSALCCVHPGTPEMLQLLPEEERHEEFIAVYTGFALSAGENGGAGGSGPAVHSSTSISSPSSRGRKRGQVFSVTVMTEAARRAPMSAASGRLWP